MQTDVISGVVSRQVADPSEVVGVLEHRPGAGASRVEEHVEWGSVVEGVVRPQHERLRADDGRTVGRQAEGVPAVLGKGLGPVGEDLPGADGVQLLHPVEDEDTDLPTRRHPRGSVVGGVGGGRACMGASSWAIVRWGAMAPDVTDPAGWTGGLAPVKMPGLPGAGCRD